MNLTAVKNSVAPQRLKKLILPAAAGFLLTLAPLAESVYPCGHALLCAVPKSMRRQVFFGCVVGGFFAKGSVLLSLFCSAYLFFVMRAADKNGRTTAFTRFLLSLSVSALGGTYVAVGGIDGGLELFSLVFSIAAPPLFTLAFFGFFDRRGEHNERLKDIALLAFSFACVTAFDRVELFGASMGLFAGALLTLYAARTRGFLFGGACGTVTGLALGSASIGALGVLGMCYGALAPEIDLLAMMLAFMMSVTGYFYLAGSESALSSAIVIAIACPLFFAFRRRFPLARSTAFQKKQFERSTARCAAAFSSLSELFYTVSQENRAVAVESKNELICSAVQGFCSRCAGCELNLSDITNYFTREIKFKGVVTIPDLPLHFVRRCPNISKMAKSVNSLGNERSEKAEQGLKKMADSYSSVSLILAEASKKQEDRLRTDRDAECRVRSALSECGVGCDGVKVTGSRIRNITVYGVQPEKISCTAADISRAVGGAVGTAVSPPDIVPNDGYPLLKLSGKPKIRIEWAKCVSAKDGESVCGDTVSVFENDEKYLYCLISDGMGSGRDASLTSRLSAIMLEKLLTVGAEKESALKLLNRALIEKEDELFATVDLLEIDRIMGTACLLKAGAAPTVLIRKGNKRIFEAKTPPAGIMSSVVAEKRQFNLEKGDVLIMMSDGVMQTGSATLPVPQKFGQSSGVQSLASEIISEAREQNRACDDMSVCVLRIY